MAFDNTKYHCEINSVPYTIAGYQKSELPTFIPRLSSGEQEESDFDLLRTKSIKGFEGGQLQRYWDDDSSFFASEGMYPIYDDGTLYPVNSVVSSTGLIGSTKAAVQAVAYSDQYMFIASQTLNTPTTSIRRIDTSGSSTTLTLTGSLSSQTVTSMVIWQNRLWIATGASGQMYYMDLTSTSISAVTSAAAGSFQLMVVWQDQLYGTNANSTFLNSYFLRYTGDTATQSFAGIGYIGGRITSYYTRLAVYNNRIMISKNDGLFAYDGTRLTTVEDMGRAIHDSNYTLMTVLKGYLYYFMPDGFYRFNGSLIEKLYDNSEIGTPVDMVAGKNRLWMIHKNDSTFGSSRYDKSMGYDNSGGNSADGRIVVFNGKGLFTYGRTSTFVKNPGTDDLAGQGTLDKVMYHGNKLWVTTWYDKQGANTYHTIDTAETSASGSKAWRIVTSIFDAEFPMIDKDMENIEAVFDGNVASDETITIEYRTAGFDGSTGWTTLGTILSQTRVKENVWRTTPAGITFKKIQFRLSGTTDVRYGFRKLVFRYLLSPDFKWQWSFNIAADGDEALAPLMLADDTESTQAVRTLRGNIYDSRMSDVPVKFVDIDQLDLNGAHNNSVTTITLNSTLLLKESGFIQIDDEVIYYAAKTSTTLTGCIRAMMSTAAASHSDNAKVFPVYRAIVRQIRNETINLTNANIDVVEDKNRASTISIVMQEV